MRVRVPPPRVVGKNPQPYALQVRNLLYNLYIYSTDGGKGNRAGFGPISSVFRSLSRGGGRKSRFSRSRRKAAPHHFTLPGNQSGTHLCGFHGPPVPPRLLFPHLEMWTLRGTELRRLQLRQNETSHCFEIWVTILVGVSRGFILPPTSSRFHFPS